MTNGPPAAPTISTSAERVAAGPFWGHPVGQEMATLGRHAPEYAYPMRTGLGLERLRWVERRTQGVQPVCKLYGPGSVGGQCLVGIPTVNQLRFDYELSEYSRVWPFEMGFTERPTPDEGPFVLHAEIWPNDRIVPRRLFDATLIRDRSQVRAIVSWLNELDGSRDLGRLFGTPEDLISEAVAASVSEEGWIIGVR